MIRDTDPRGDRGRDAEPDLRDPEPELGDEELDWILSHLDETEPEEYTRPADEAMLAYLDGTATAAQRVEVQRACLQSRLFRLELIDLAEDLENLARAQAEEARAEKNLAMLQGLGRMILSAFSPLPASRFVPVTLRSPRYGRDADGGLSGPKPGGSSGRSGELFQTRLRHLHPSIWVGSADYHPQPSKAAPTAEEAAILCFAERVVWIDGAFRVTQPGPCPDQRGAAVQAGAASGEPGATASIEAGTAASGEVGVAAPGEPGAAEATASGEPEIPASGDSGLPMSITTVEAHLYSPSGEPQLTACFHIPADAPETRLWSLLIPALNLYCAPEGTTSLRLVWPGEAPAVACLALTYRSGDGFRAVSPVWQSAA